MRGGSFRSSIFTWGIPMTVGENVLRRDGYGKVTGSARYVDDISLDGMIYGKTVRSTIARGRIRSLNFDPAFF